MSTYKFKKVPASEKNKLILFIDRYWKKNHALVLSDALLNFQHYSKIDDGYNFLVAEDVVGAYDAIVGFIQTSQYDEKLYVNGDYWGAIWKYREDSHNPEINAAALYLWKKLFKLPNFQSYAAIGISDIARRIYEVSRMNMGCLSQYYILNDRINNYHIAANVDIYQQKQSISDNGLFKVRPIKLSNVRDEIQPYYRPYKSMDYFRNRYENHPIYKYKFIGIFNNNRIFSLWACREITVNGSKVLRVIDVLGKLGGYLYSQLLQLLYDHDYEYLDIMNYGIPEKFFCEMGFSKLDINGSLILPNYFEPFEQRNIKINLAYTSNYPDYVIFKGDSDQDRPNVL